MESGEKGQIGERCGLTACLRNPSFHPQILVHGEQNEMARLKAALIREYEDNDQVHIEVHNPRNTEAVTLNFRGEKLAKVASKNEHVYQIKPI